MRNKYNASWHEGSKYYNTNQNNTDESNLDNNRSKNKKNYPSPLSYVEFGNEINPNIYNGQKFIEDQDINKQQEYQKSNRNRRTK